MSLRSDSRPQSIPGSGPSLAIKVAVPYSLVVRERVRIMPSPFPGMDPYLEDPGIWPDFHFTFLFCWREAVADLLSDQYEARIDETVRLVQMKPEVIKLI